MADIPAFQSHHIIEQQVVEKSALIGKLQEFGLFNVNDARNLLNMPVDRELAAKMGISPHNGGPLSSYSDGLADKLEKLEKGLDGQAALAGDKAAAGRIIERVNTMRDTMRAGLINGHLFTNTPKGLSSKITNTKNAEFLGDLDGYNQKHADQIGKFSKAAGNEWGAATTSEARIKAALDAIEQDGVKAAKGPAEAAKNSLGVAIAQARDVGTLTLSELFATSLRGTFMKGLKGVGAAGIAADIAVSTAEAKGLAAKGDVTGATSIMNGLGARLAFGWVGAEWGATAGTAAGPYGTVIGGILGGLVGLVGGEALVKGIEEAANQLTGIFNSNGTQASEAKAPEATINPDGSAIITTFNPDNNKPASTKTFEKDGKLKSETRSEYDPLTNVKTKEEMYDRDGKKTDAKSFDRETGALVSETHFNAQGGVSSKTTYNADGENKASTKTYDSNGQLKSETRSEYDPLTHVRTKEDIYRQDGKQRATKSFDRETGKATSETHFNAQGGVDTKTTYNADGGKLMEFFNQKTGIISGTHEYNKDGKITVKTDYAPNGAISIKSVTDYDPVTGKDNSYRQYNVNGSLVFESIYDPKTGKKVGYKHYDNQGNLEKHVTIDPDTKKVVKDHLAEAKAAQRAAERAEIDRRNAEFAAAAKAAAVARAAECPTSAPLRQNWFN